MKIKYLLAASVVSLSAAAAVTAPAYAQTITSGIEGTVTDPEGNALPGATVTIVDTRTNTERTTTAGSNGNFRVGQLPPGGPYTVTVTAPGYEGQTVENIFTNISGNTAFDFALDATVAGSADSVIVVTGARARVSQVAVGPGTAFGTQELEAFPSITRDVRDIIRIDPRVSLELANDVDRISCLGGNDRSNTFTVDGIVQADVFGLNGQPFAARNSFPLPFDTIEQTSVEFAPFDVEYSEFTGCLINVVTKAGTNEFSGSAFFTYFDNGLFADDIDGRPLTAGEEKRWGATLSGPIIPDRVFFSFGYEEIDLGQGNNFGPAGGGFTNEFDFVSQAQFDEFAQIARDVYGQDPGPYPTNLQNSSVRYFGRLDAQITERHRFEATYQRLDELRIESDFGGQNITGVNSFETEGTISDIYSLRLYSDWSDNISTELRVSRAEVSDQQGPFGFNEAQDADPTVRLVVGVMPDGTPVEGGADGVTDQNGILSTGPGIFRSANDLQTKIDQARFILNYDAGNGHFLKFGAELNDLEVFNLFAVNATGSLYFQNLDDFRNGLLSPGEELFPDADEVATGAALGGDINAALGGDINNAAASFSRRIYSLFVQDEWQATDQLAINAGVRVQIYDGGRPRANPLFLERYGFTNAVSFGQIDTVLLPRISATYNFDNDGFFSNSSLTGGVGVFSGGDPVVFFSNAFTNDGFGTGLGTTRFSCDPGDIAVDAGTGQLDVTPNGGAFTGLPRCLVDGGAAGAAAGSGNLDSTNPDFDVPTVVRANIGFRTDFGAETGFFSNWNLQLDYIYSRFNDNLNFVDLASGLDTSRGLNGFTVDGRPLYSPIDTANAGCNATLTGNGGTEPPFTGLSPECFAGGRTNEIQLTNGQSTESHVFSAVISKQFQGGVFTDNGSVRLNFGYAFTDSESLFEGASSRAVSNYGGTALFDRQNAVPATSEFETRHNFTASLFFREEFVEGYDTGLGIFFRAAEGRPYSLTFDGRSNFGVLTSGGDSDLLYIPTGINDPNISDFTGLGFSATQVAALQAAQAPVLENVVDYLANSETAASCDFTPGQSIERNSCRNDWLFDMDLRISQELPFIGSLTGIKEDRIEIFADFANILNLFDSSWNVFRSRTDNVDIIDTGITVDDPDNPGEEISVGAVDSQGRYVISGFRPDDQNNININASAWRIQLGVRYEF